MYDLVKHSKFVYEYQNCVSKSWCDYMIAALKKGMQTEKMHEKNEVRHNRAYCITTSSNEEIKKLHFLVHEKINRAHDLYTTNNKDIFPVLNLLSSHLDTHTLESDFVYRTYDENDYYDWHVDRKIGGSDFYFSYLLYLNDDFCGGNTLFLHDKLKIAPKVGSIICFPCDTYMAHKSTKILKGEKHIIWTCLEAREKEGSGYSKNDIRSL